MEIQYERIPDGLFFKSNMLLDIRCAYIVRGVGRGEGDIELVSPLGFSERVSRVELLERYRYIDGSVIKLGAWLGKRRYLVVNRCNNGMYGIYIPPRVLLKRGEVELKVGRTGVYIICGSGDMGEIDRDKVYVVVPKYFKRMFKMEGNLDDCRELRDRLLKRGVVKEVKCEINNRGGLRGALDSIMDNIERSTIKLDKESVTSIQDVGVKKENSDVGNNAVGNNNIDGNLKDERSKSVKDERYKLVARITQGGRMVGFIVEDIYGVKVECNKGKVIEFARKRLLSNASIRNKNGKEYLYGIGIKLMELPEVSM